MIVLETVINEEAMPIFENSKCVTIVCQTEIKALNEIRC